MTKHFCDLCGQEAMSIWPEMRVDFPELTWQGAISKCASNVEGAWVPYIDARIVFEAHDMPRSTRPHNPDLCAHCMADLLMKMAVAISKDPTHPSGMPLAVAEALAKSLTGS